MSAAAATGTASGGTAGNGGMGTTDPESHYGHDGVSRDGNAGSFRVFVLLHMATFSDLHYFRSPAIVLSHCCVC